MIFVQFMTSGKVEYDKIERKSSKKARTEGYDRRCKTKLVKGP